MKKSHQEKKVWGFVYHAFDDDNCAVSVLHTQAGGYCSRHTHTERINRFLVVSGCIDVVRYSDDGSKEISRTSLKEGDIEDVGAGVVHSFEVVEPGVVVEVYSPAFNGAKVRLDDINRLKLGGSR